jgi:histidine triad (HIT) family protein
MSNDCIFCSIVDGDIPARVVYEDADTIAFLDANPLAKGHTLVIPKEHYEDFEAMPPEPGEMVMAALHYLTPKVENAVDAEATTVAFNNGEAAGQEVTHVHGHIVPRFEGDGGRPVHALFDSRPEVSDDELDDIAERISADA